VHPVSTNCGSDNLTEVDNLKRRLDNAEAAMDLLKAQQMMFAEFALDDAKEQLRTVAYQVLDFFIARSQSRQFTYEEKSRLWFIRSDFARVKQLQQFFTEQKFDQSTFAAAGSGGYDDNDDSTCNKPYESRLIASAEAALQRYDRLMLLTSSVH
jgi:hypothetical protein